MIVLLSVGQAMLDQSRDVSLVGGGELTVLPQGIDIEAMRTGGVSGMFFGIDRARFLTRQVLGGPRHQRLVRVVSPVIEGKLLYLRHGQQTVAVRAGADIPSRASAVGSGLDVRSGHWKDSPTDSAYVVPTTQQFYNQLDHFHLPAQPDSTWGEWHYFNLVTGPDEWWYVTYLIGGEVPTGRWGGQLLITHRQPGGGYERFEAVAPPHQVRFDTAVADLKIAQSYVRQSDGTYTLHAQASGATGAVSIDVTLVPARNRYFPPVELRDDAFLSGYVVPALSAKASGKICVGQRCRRFTEAPGYHDHNWGVWRDVTWEWGTGAGSRVNLLYGGVYGPVRQADEKSRSASPFFLALVDSAGVKQVLRFGTIRYEGARRVTGSTRATAPARFSLLATRESDTVHLAVNVVDALATEMSAGEFRRVFLQMRGQFRVTGQVAGETVEDSGTGFFETYVTE
jgi:hypothetical protein